MRPLDRGELYETEAGRSDDTARDQVAQAHQIQLERQGCLNSRLGQKMLSLHCELASSHITLLEDAAKKLNLSARAQHRIIKVAWTIADLDGTAGVEESHLLEALSYRSMDSQSEH